MSDIHPNSFTFERLVANECSESDAAALRSHVASCSACATTYSEILKEKQAFTSAVPYAPFRIEHEKRRATVPSRGRWQWLWALSMAGATCGLVLVWQAAQKPYDGNVYETRLKGGGVTLHAWHKGNSGNDVLVAGSKIAPGDTLQLGYDAAAYTHVVVFGVDANAQVTTYYPDELESNNNVMAPLPQGARGLLPFSLKMDGSVGIENFVAIYAHEARDVATLKRTVEAWAQSKNPDRRLQLDNTFAQAWFWVEK